MRARTDVRGILQVSLLLAVAAAAGPASADWLVTRDGSTLETRGTWKVDGERVLFHDSKGRLVSLATAEVDLEASRLATRMAAAPPVAKRPEPAEREVLRITNADIPTVPDTGPAARLEASEAPAAPKVTLYSTAWCGYCRMARKLLQELEVPYVEKDIEKSAEARREHIARAGRGGGVPVVDIDGRVIRGYNPDSIRLLVTDLQEREVAEAEPDEGEEGTETAEEP